MREGGVPNHPEVGGWLGSCVSNIRSLLPSIYSKCIIWKLPRTIWKPLIRKVACSGRELHWLLEALDWISPSQTEDLVTSKDHRLGPAPPCSDPADVDHFDSWAAELVWRVKLLSPQISKEPHLAQVGPWFRPWASSFVTLEYLDTNILNIRIFRGMRLHLESCPRSHRSVGLILCTAYRN